MKIHISNLKYKQNKRIRPPFAFQVHKSSVEFKKLKFELNIAYRTMEQDSIIQHSEKNDKPHKTLRSSSSVWNSTEEVMQMEYNVEIQ